MLQRRTRLSKPAVVRDIHQQPGPLLGEHANLIRKNGLVTDERSQLVAVHRKYQPLGTGNKITNFFGQLLGEAEHVLERNILSERNQVDFVVTCNQSSGRGNTSLE